MEKKEARSCDFSVLLASNLEYNPFICIRTNKVTVLALVCLI